MGTGVAFWKPRLGILPSGVSFLLGPEMEFCVPEPRSYIFRDPKLGGRVTRVGLYIRELLVRRRGSSFAALWQPLGWHVTLLFLREMTDPEGAAAAMEAQLPVFRLVWFSLRRPHEHFGHMQGWVPLCPEGDFFLRLEAAREAVRDGARTRLRGPSEPHMSIPEAPDSFWDVTSAGFRAVRVWPDPLGTTAAGTAPDWLLPTGPPGIGPSPVPPPLPPTVPPKPVGPVPPVGGLPVPPRPFVEQVPPPGVPPMPRRPAPW